MSGEHYLEFLNFATGTRLGISTGATGSGPSARNGFRRVTTHKAVNAPGSIDMELPYQHPLLQFTDKTLVVDWRRDKARNIDWYRHHVGLIRDPSYYSNKGNRYVTVQASGLAVLLDWYIVAWAAGVVNRTSFVAAKGETIMKTLVTQNVITPTTAVGGIDRDRQPANYGISVQANAAAGNTINWVAGRNHTLLEELQLLTFVAGGDFDLVYLTATTREFRFYLGQRGADKHLTVTFAENLGNMDNVVFRQIRSNERTVAIVGGQGDLSDRDIVVRTGPNYAATNDIEAFIDARDIAKGATTALQYRGDARLAEIMARQEFSFDVVQTDGTAYERDYTVGDLVSAVRPDGVKVTQQVYSATTNYVPGSPEQVSIGVWTK